ncbi:hypothetical protein [Sphingobacterium corticibacter]|uniref:Uncharacterized protein n=1 Tax=Sphingobacterium corticibacter TaxID=2171749 RepID=A0A2T8HNJ5_9SPHI|nr:hypothetical protein [Sphingobacterium corticibacter]PVH26985.1 hypothetical protein DC487_05160 [Sphingobacterium corticibacter]
MNFGLTILAVFYIIYLVVPGIFFKRFYFQSKFNKEFYSGSFADKIITSIFWGIIIQLIIVLIFMSVSSMDMSQLYIRCKNIYSDLQTNSLPDVSDFQLKTLLVLFILSMILACTLGHIVHKAIRLLKLDIKFSPLRFSNEWNYLFRNELNHDDFKLNKYRNSYHSTQVDVFVNDSSEDKPNFYTGVLHDYSLDQDGQLDRISLSIAKKRIIKEGAKEYSDVAGDILIIPYRNISNLNLRFNYIYKEKKDKDYTLLQGFAGIIFMIVFFGTIIIPLVFASSFMQGVYSAFLLFLSWAFSLAVFADFFNNKTDRTVSWRHRFVLFIFSIISGYGGLYLLEIVNLDFLRF